MVVSPYPSELPSSPTLPAPARPTSLDHESTMEITSAILDTHLDETEAPGAVIIAEKEKQANGLTEGSPPPTSTSVQFIGINYVPDSTDVATTSRPTPQQHPVPWESGATSPTSEGHVVIGLSTFPPTPCVIFTLFYLPSLSPLSPQKTGKEKKEKKENVFQRSNISPYFYFLPRFFWLGSHVELLLQAGEAQSGAGFVLPSRAAARGLGVFYAACGTDWRAPSAGDRSR